MSKPFYLEPLTADDNNYQLIQDFTIDREKEYSHIPNTIIGLEAYLKRSAWRDMLNNQVCIYLIKDSKLGDVVAYFGLKAGMVVDSESGMPSDEERQEVMEEYGAKLLPEVVPGIEITHFAVNDNYRRKAGKEGSPVRGLGEYIYPQFIYPIIEDVAQKIGVGLIYLYAAGDERLISYYKRVFDFQVLDAADFIIPLEPGYDDGCTFMYRTI